MTTDEARQDLIAQARLDGNLYKGLVWDSDGKPTEEAVGATSLLTKACVWWSKLTYCNYSASTTLTLVVNQTTPYDCRDRTTPVVSAKVLKPRTVVINDTRLYRRDGRDYGLWTWGEFTRLHPDFQLAAAAQPYIAIWQPNNKLFLHSKTDALYTGKNYIEGWTIPDDLQNGADDDVQLPVPEEDHDAIVRLALAFGSMPFASEQSSWNFVQANDSWWREQALRRKQENLTTFLGRKPRGSKADWLMR